MNFYYNNYLNKLFIKKAIFILILFILVLLSVAFMYRYRVEQKFLLIGSIFILITIGYSRKLYIDLIKLYVGIKAEVKVNNTLKSSGVMFSRNIIIKGTEIDNIVFFPTLLVMETKYGKGSILKSGNNYYVGKKLITNKMFSQIDRNLNKFNLILPNDLQKAKGVLCFSDGEGILELNNGKLFLVGNRSLSKWLKNQKPEPLLSYDSAAKFKKFIENS